MKTSRMALVAWAVSMALPGLARAQQDPPSVFGEEIDVRVVNVEVVVTDGKGNRVPDLKAGDFRLKVDGKPVPVEYFTEVREGQAVAAPAPAAPEASEAPRAVAGPPAVEPGAPVGINYLVFIDDYFLVARQRDDVLQSIRKDLANLRPADRMSVIAWDGGRLSRLADWTGSREEIEKALDQAKARPTRGLDRVADYQRFLTTDGFAKKAQQGADVPGDSDTDPQSLQVRFASSELSPQELAYGQGLAHQLTSAVSAVVSAMRGSAAPSGRKVLLVLAGGWPFSIQSYIRGGNPPPLSHELPSGEQIFGPLARTANLLGYTIYSVDVPGVTSVAADALSEPMEGRGSVIMGSSATGDRPGQQLHAREFGNQAAMPSTLTDTRSFIEQELQGSLEYMAKETGGKPLLNSNRTLALASASADTRSYYWLGFSPSWKRNDKSHRIVVEVLRPGLQARSRSDFLDLSRQAEVAMKLESALLFGGGVAGAERLAIRLGAPVPGKGTAVEIPVTLGIPVSAMTVLPVDGKYAAELELRFAATDERGNQSENLPSVPLKLSSDHPPAQGKLVRYDTKIVLNGKAQRIAVAVYDRGSGKIAAAEAEIGGK
jgi:VWFA-related protein